MVDPLEYRLAALQRALQERLYALLLGACFAAARHVAQAEEAACEQSLARQVEQRRGMLVGVDELVAADVEDEDRLGRVLDERPVALLVFA